MTQKNTITLLEPQKIIKSSDLEYEVFKKDAVIWDKKAANVVPYIESIPYTDDYILAKTAEALNMSITDVKNATSVYWKEVVRNMKDPQFKRVILEGIGLFRLQKGKLRTLLQKTLLPLAQRQRKSAQSRSEYKDISNSTTYKRLFTTWRLYRSLTKPAKFLHTYVPKKK